jgi:toxin ParE1/3/4
MRVQLAPRARLDLIHIGDYLERESGKRTALRWLYRLEKKAMSLGEQPYAGAEDAYLGGRRRLVVRPYLIVYRIENSIVRVSRIVHGARDLPTLFASEEE